jgi:[acyl-carrier-protein] S-malonyltransferase
MSQTLAMFPGQGSQFVGMGRDLLTEFPASKLAFEEAADAARINVRKLCLDGPEEDLKLTANTQPCILTMSVAVWRVLVAETGIAPTYFAGHSLGEYSAVVAAGKMTLGRAALLVRKRGEAMQAAVPAGVGAMAAVMNMPAEELLAACGNASKPGSVVEVVNFNSAQQLVVAGHKTAVDALCVKLEAASVRFVPLPVSAPFHSSLMKPARDAMAPLLEETRLDNTSSQVIANLTGKVAHPYETSLLIQQINSPVLWTQTLATAVEAGCETYVEVGPGKVLFGLARRGLPRTVKLMHTEDVRKTIADLKA